MKAVILLGTMAALAQFDPEITKILETERAALAPAATPPPADRVYECLGKCPNGVSPPRFAFFPQLGVSMNASVGVYDTRLRTFLMFETVVSAEGLIEPETLIMTSGTARGTESDLRRDLAQARFSPGRAGGVPVRTRIRIRFDFEAAEHHGAVIVL